MIGVAWGLVGPSHSLCVLTPHRCEELTRSKLKSDNARLLSRLPFFFQRIYRLLDLRQFMNHPQMSVMVSEQDKDTLNYQLKGQAGDTDNCGRGMHGEGRGNDISLKTVKDSSSIKRFHTHPTPTPPPHFVLAGGGSPASLAARSHSLFRRTSISRMK